MKFSTAYLFALVSLSIIPLLQNNRLSFAAPTSCEPSRIRIVSLSVQDKQGLFIDSMSASDLSLTENKVPVEIVKLEPKTNQPVSAVILIDASMSQENTLVQSMLAGQKFVEWILKSKRDRAAVVSFSGDAVVEADLTDNRTKLLGAISKIDLDRPPDYALGGITQGKTPPIRPRKQGLTFMWDALWASTDGILKSVSDTRRLIILFTDGEDSTSLEKMRETIRFVAGNDVTVFAVYFSDNRYYLFGRSNLEELTENTGGRAFFPKKEKDLAEILLKTEIHARSYYAVTYCAAPSTTGEPAKLHLEITNPALRRSDVRLSYRRLGL